MKRMPLLRQKQCWPRARSGTASDEAVAHLLESCNSIKPPMAVRLADFAGKGGPNAGVLT